MSIFVLRTTEGWMILDKGQDGSVAISLSHHKQDATVFNDGAIDMKFFAALRERFPDVQMWPVEAHVVITEPGQKLLDAILPVIKPEFLGPVIVDEAWDKLRHELVDRYER